MCNSLRTRIDVEVTANATGAEYVPTQILAEAVKCEGFDGIVYKSLFGGERGYKRRSVQRG